MTIKTINCLFHGPSIVKLSEVQCPKCKAHEFDQALAARAKEAIEKAIEQG